MVLAVYHCTIPQFLWMIHQWFVTWISVRSFCTTDLTARHVVNISPQNHQEDIQFSRSWFNLNVSGERERHLFVFCQRRCLANAFIDWGDNACETFTIKRNVFSRFSRKNVQWTTGPLAGQFVRWLKYIPYIYIWTPFLKGQTQHIIHSILVPNNTTDETSNSPSLHITRHGADVEVL